MWIVIEHIQKIGIAEISRIVAFCKLLYSYSREGNEWKLRLYTFTLVSRGFHLG